MSQKRLMLVRRFWRFYLILKTILINKFFGSVLFHKYFSLSQHSCTQCPPVTSFRKNLRWIIIIFEVLYSSFNFAELLLITCSQVLKTWKVISSHGRHRWIKNSDVKYAFFFYIHTNNIFFFQYINVFLLHCVLSERVNSVHVAQ